MPPPVDGLAAARSRRGDTYARRVPAARDERAPEGSVSAAVSEAILAVAAERSVDQVLERLVHAARELVGARYAAIGVPDDEDPTAFAQFLTSGMTDELIDELGDLPRTHGMLGATLVERQSFRTADITLDPRFRGWWPPAHPTMHSFLGVPIVRHDQVLGAFYLTDKERARRPSRPRTSASSSCWPPTPPWPSSTPNCTKRAGSAASPRNATAWPASCTTR